MENDILKSPGQLGIAMDAVLERVLMKGLALYAADRYQSVQEMKAALDGTAAEEQNAGGSSQEQKGTSKGNGRTSQEARGADWTYQEPDGAAQNTPKVTRAAGTETVAEPLTFWEFILTEIFSALILVSMLIAAAITKTGSIIFYPLIALLTAPAYMWIVTGIHKKGTIFLSCVVPVICFWVSEARILCIYLVAAGIIGEIMASRAHWKSYKILALTHILYNVTYSGFVIFDYYKTAGEHYYDSLWMDILVIALTAAAAAVGALVMRLVLNKSLKWEKIFVE